MFLIFFFFFCSSNSMFFFFFFFFFFFVSAKDYRSSDLLRRLVMSLSRYLSSTPPLGVTLRVFNVPGAIVIREARPSYYAGTSPNPSLGITRLKPLLLGEPCGLHTRKVQDFSFAGCRCWRQPRCSRRSAAESVRMA